MSDPYKYEVLIREHHIDLLGHVNNATYLQLYEEARWQFISERGFTIETMQNEKIGPVIIEAQIKYIKEIKLRQKIAITFELLGYNKKIGKMKQQMFNENNELCSEAIFVFGLFDLVERKLILPNELWNHATGFVTAKN